MFSKKTSAILPYNHNIIIEIIYHDDIDDVNDSNVTIIDIGPARLRQQRPTQAFRNMQWLRPFATDPAVEAWKNGTTGFPLVDAVTWWQSFLGSDDLRPLGMPRGPWDVGDCFFSSPIFCSWDDFFRAIIDLDLVKGKLAGAHWVDAILLYTWVCVYKIILFVAIHGCKMKESYLTSVVWSGRFLGGVSE